MNKYILVIDDEQEILDIVRFCLRMYRYSVCTFTDPIMALDHFKSNPKSHQMVISDIMMPQMNGYELVKQIQKINSKVKVVLMTSFEMLDEEFSNILPDVNIGVFIKKPFSPQMLRRMVIRQRKRSNELRDIQTRITASH